jgi:hypothetical protein
VHDVALGLRALLVRTVISFHLWGDLKLNAFSQLKQRFAIIAFFEHGHHLSPWTISLFVGQYRFKADADGDAVLAILDGQQN